MGGSSQQPVTQQTTQNKDPWAPAQPFLKESMENAQGYFQSGTGYNPYTGETQAPLSSITQGGLAGMLGNANPDVNNQYSRQLAEAMITGRGMSPETQDVYNRYSQLGLDASSYANPSIQQWSQIYQSAPEYARTQAGQWGDIYNNAQSLAQQPAQQYGDIYSNAALLAQQPAQQYKDLYSAFANATVNPLNKYEQQYGDVGNYAGDTRSRYQTLYDEASGNQNPYLDSILATSNRRIGDQVGSAMSGSGRYGSGQHTDVAARAMAEAADPVLAQDYQARQQQKMAATGAMAQAYDTLANQRGAITQGIGNISNMGLQGQLAANQGLNNVYNNMLSQQGAATQGLNSVYNTMLGQQAGATQGLGNTYNNLLQQQAGATQGLGGTYNTLFGQRAGVTDQMNNLFNQGLNRAGQWAQTAPSLYEQSFAPYQQQMNVGSVYDQRAQAQLQDQIKLYNAQQALPWEQLARYNAIAGQAGGLGGTQVTSTPIGQQPSSIQKLLGGGMAGAGLGGTIGGPIGAGVGAVGGGLLGLFG